MKKSFLIALIISIIAFLWILSGMIGQDQNDASDATTTNAQPAKIEQTKLPQVRIRNLSAQRMDDTVEVTGRTQAVRAVTVAAETQGQIASLNFQKGSTVQKGQILARLNVKDRNARLQEAKQLLNQREIQYKAAKELTAKGYNSRVRLAESQAAVEAARAQVKQTQEELKNTVITAPFNGIINQQMVEIGDFVSVGNPIAQIVDLSSIEIVGFLTEKQIGQVQEGNAISASLLNDQIVDGKVTFIAAAADQDTRTFEMEMTVPNPNNKIKEGLTAKIMVPFTQDQAYKISPSVLSLDEEGRIGVKILNNQDQVLFKPVTLLKDTPDYLWITGLPPSIRLITVGQEFVSEGQQVQPSEADVNENSESGLL